MSKHTPTPWKFAGRAGGWDGVDASDGTNICHLEYNNPANAAFIVKAVNLHDELVAALKAALPHLAEHHQDTGAYDAAKLVEAALSKAEAS